MLKPPHRPTLLQSHIPYDRNRLVQEHISETKMISTEYWDHEPSRVWIDNGVVTAKKGYTWITKWEVGKNYISTRILDEKGKLVGDYWDITSPVTKIDDHYQAYDWYLDVFKVAGQQPVLLDEDELEAAVKAGFITSEEAEVARKVAKNIMEKVQNEMVDFIN